MRSNQIKIQSWWIRLAGPSFTDSYPYERDTWSSGTQTDGDGKRPSWRSHTKTETGDGMIVI